MKLFCFPYAGGFSSIYSRWRNTLVSNTLTLHPIDIRPQRFENIQDDKLLGTISELVDYVYSQVKLHILEDDFAFYGHSMGGLIAYELTRKLLIEDNIKPNHLFLSASRPPHMYTKLNKTYDLPRGEFVNVLRELGGTPEAVLDNDELLDLLLPFIRADFQAIQTFEYKSRRIDKIPVDFTILYGIDDSINSSEILSWKNYCAGDCDFYPIDGGHFFIHNQTKIIIDIVTSVLEKKGSIKY